MLCQSAFLVFLLIALSNGFPDGAPADTCVKERFNQPNHGAARSQPLGTLPYEIRATTDTYQPGQQIQGYYNTEKFKFSSFFSNETANIFGFSIIYLFTSNNSEYSWIRTFPRLLLASQRCRIE